MCFEFKKSEMKIMKILNSNSVQLDAIRRQLCCLTRYRKRAQHETDERENAIMLILTENICLAHSDATKEEEACAAFKQAASIHDG